MKLRIVRKLLVCGILLSSTWRLGAEARETRYAPGQLHDLQDIEQFRTLFNDETGRARLVLLLSPTCLFCIAGARWVQKELLERLPSANLRVYAVWVKMLTGDDRSRWPKDLLTDSRAIHFWDPQIAVGKFYRDHLLVNEGNAAGGLWDVYILYDEQASWKGNPSPPASWGYGIRPGAVTILRTLLLPLLPR